MSGAFTISRNANHNLHRPASRCCSVWLTLVNSVSTTLNVDDTSSAMKIGVSQLFERLTRAIEQRAKNIATFNPSPAWKFTRLLTRLTDRLASHEYGILLHHRFNEPKFRYT